MLMSRVHCIAAPPGTVCFSLIPTNLSFIEAPTRSKKNTGDNARIDSENNRGGSGGGGGEHDGAPTVSD